MALYLNLKDIASPNRVRACCGKVCGLCRQEHATSESGTLSRCRSDSTSTESGLVDLALPMGRVCEPVSVDVYPPTWAFRDLHLAVAHYQSREIEAVLPGIIVGTFD